MKWTKLLAYNSKNIFFQIWTCPGHVLSTAGVRDYKQSIYFSVESNNVARLFPPDIWNQIPTQEEFVVCVTMHHRHN